MTLETLLCLADECTKCYTSTHAPGHQLALAVLSLLAESAPCGFEAPKVLRRVHGENWIEIPVSWAPIASPDDARAMARMLLSAADSAEARGDSK